MENDDKKRIVQQGYNQISQVYEDWTQTVRVDERTHYENLILDRLPDGAIVLEMGCGSGVPTTRRLATKLKVTGVDLSDEQIRRAREHVPEATFIQQDMTRVDFPDDHFDAVVAFYSITK